MYSLSARSTSRRLQASRSSRGSRAEATWGSTERGSKGEVRPHRRAVEAHRLKIVCPCCMQHRVVVTDPFHLVVFVVGDSSPPTSYVSPLRFRRWWQVVAPRGGAAAGQRTTWIRALDWRRGPMTGGSGHGGGDA